MKGKNVIILVLGVIVGVIAGFISCIAAICKAFVWFMNINEGLCTVIKNSLVDTINYILYADDPNKRKHLKVRYSPYSNRNSSERNLYFCLDGRSFYSRSEAQAAVNRMIDDIDQYSFISIANAYEICRISKPISDYEELYGWVHRIDYKIELGVDGKFKIFLPEPVKIDDNL